MNIKWIFFDVGGVLVDESSDTFWRQEYAVKVLDEMGFEVTLSDIKKRWPEISAMIGSLDLNVFKLFMKNEDLANQAFKKFKELKKERAPYIEMIKVRTEAIPIISELSKKYKLGLIANQSPNIKVKLKTAGLLNFFDQHTVSSEHGFEKPDPKLFKEVFKETGADPKFSIIIDDNIERSLVPAKKLGMTTIWYKLKNRNDVPNGVVDYTITSFEELLTILH